jgi:hypothetical protein
MNSRYACIKNGIVDNMIVIEDGDSADQIISDIESALGYSDLIKVDDDIIVDIGYYYYPDDGSFVSPT